MILSYLRGFDDRPRDKRTDIGNCRVTFVTEKLIEIHIS